MGTKSEYEKLNKAAPAAPNPAAQPPTQSAGVQSGSSANAPVSAPSPSPPASDPALIVAVQEALNHLGFEAGPPDGTLGARTQNAIRQYEKSVGMPEDGQITPQLAVSLQTALAIEQRQASAPAATPKPPTATANGSGFYISNTALVLTNYHVVKGCRSVTVGGARSSVLSIDSKNDLAVLSAPPRSGNVAALRDRPAVRAGVDEIAAFSELGDYLDMPLNS